MFLYTASVGVPVCPYGVYHDVLSSGPGRGPLLHVSASFFLPSHFMTLFTVKGKTPNEMSAILLWNQLSCSVHMQMFF